MNYETAKKMLDIQDHNIRKINDFRFIKNGYEYKVIYEGGFTCFIAIHRRQVGKRNFKYFRGFGAYNCWNIEQVINKINDII